MAPSALIFDLDGTISEPVQGIGRSINHALVSHGHAPLAEHEVSQYIGPPLDASFRAIVPGADEAHVLALVASYRERYGDVGYAENELYEGVPEALKALLAQGHRLGLCTSKRADFAEKILQMFGLRALFSFVSGGEIGVSKAMQLRELREMGQAGERSLMVGDRAVDVLSARDNGLRAIGVLWGHGSAEELSAAGPLQLLRRTDELAGIGRWL